jgi:heat shock protein beta
LKRIIQTFTKLAEDEPDKFADAQKVYGNMFKLGAVEDSKNKDKLTPLIRFATNQRNATSLDEVSFCRVDAFDQLTLVGSISRTRRLVRNKYSTSLMLARVCHP